MSFIKSEAEMNAFQNFDHKNVQSKKMTSSAQYTANLSFRRKKNLPSTQFINPDLRTLGRSCNVAIAQLVTFRTTTIFGVKIIFDSSNDLMKPHVLAIFFFEFLKLLRTPYSAYMSKCTKYHYFLGILGEKKLYYMADKC